MKLRLALYAFLALAISNVTIGQSPEPPNGWMCIAGDLVFSDDFDPETVSERWWFKGDFALRDGGLLRTSVDPNETKRVFLKGPAFHNVIVQFDFKLSGQTTDLRLVTGSGGGYNSVTQIRDDHFQINTPIDRDAGLVPAHLGECNRSLATDQWRTMTVEYWDNQIVAHLSHDEYVIGNHPILDRTRTYFAFQFDLPGASLDNVRVWKANGQRENWQTTRQQLASDQANRDPVIRAPADRHKYDLTNVRSRLTLSDSAYRDLVAKHDKLQDALHKDYHDAFISHKQISKRIAKAKQQIKETDPEFSLMETAVHQAARAEDAYVLTTKPDLANLKANGKPKQRFVSELAQTRAKLESAGDKQLAALVTETAAKQTALEARFPEAFGSIEAAIEERNAKRKALNDDADFQSRNRIVVESFKAIKDYEEEAHRRLF